jgi:hypothetical protein
VPVERTVQGNRQGALEELERMRVGEPLSRCAFLDKVTAKIEKSWGLRGRAPTAREFRENVIAVRKAARSLALAMEAEGVQEVAAPNDAPWDPPFECRDFHVLEDLLKRFIGGCDAFLGFAEKGRAPLSTSQDLYRRIDGKEIALEEMAVSWMHYFGARPGWEDASQFGCFLRAFLGDAAPGERMRRRVFARIATSASVASLPRARRGPKPRRDRRTN